VTQILELVPTNSAASGGVVDVWPEGGWSNVADVGGHPRRVPAAIPRSQAYYWSHVWQKGIEDSRAALAAGDFRDFDDATELIRWLLTDED
jgi:hypothetical protein